MQRPHIRSATARQKGRERDTGITQGIKVSRQVLRPASVVGRGRKTKEPAQGKIKNPSIIGSKVRLARKPVCCKGLCIIAMANEPYAGQLICADCGKHRAWLSHKVAKFIEETQRRFGAPEIITIGTPPERTELRNRDYDLPDGARAEIGNPAFPPRLYLKPQLYGTKTPNTRPVFGVYPIPKGWAKFGTAKATKTRATVIAAEKTHREIADTVAFLSERYGKHNVHVILKQRMEAPAIKPLDDDGNELTAQDTGDDEMRASDMFPSKYLKSSDVKDKPVTATISHVSVELVGQGKDQERKPVLHFEGNAKPMVLNKTNAITLDNAFGDTEEWAGHKVRIHCVETTYGGRAIDGIRVKPLAAGKAAPPPPDEVTDDQLA
jgi:hypothetical protein